ncbi:hypothetical protein ACSVH2_10660 [Flavobacterium sp. RSB2_4_14]
MAIKKIHVIATKKSDAKKNKEASKTKSTHPEQKIKKKLNEFGDDDAI